MKLRHVFAVNAVVNLPYALGFIFAPKTVLMLYGIQEDVAGLMMMGRLFGAAILTVAGLAWVSGLVAETSAGRALALANAGGAAVGAVIFLHAQLTHIVNAMGWGVVAIYAGFSAAYAYAALGAAGQRSAAATERL